MKTFMECASCASKPGSPALCVSCIYNRNLVAELNVEVYEARTEGWNAAVEACVAIAESVINSRQSTMNPTYGVGINDAAKSISANIRALSAANATRGREFWEQCAKDARKMMEEANAPKKKHGLKLALDWFEIRLREDFGNTKAAAVNPE